MNNNLDFINQLQERVKLAQSIATPNPQSGDYTNHLPNAQSTLAYLEGSSVQLRNALSRLVLTPGVPPQDLHELLECVGRIDHIAKKVSELQGSYK